MTRRARVRLWVGGVCLNLLPQIAYMHIYGSGVADVLIIPPNFFKQLAPVKGLVRILRQIGEQLELG